MWNIRVIKKIIHECLQGHFRMKEKKKLFNYTLINKSNSFLSFSAALFLILFYCY